MAMPTTSPKVKSGTGSLTGQSHSLKPENSSLAAKAALSTAKSRHLTTDEFAKELGMSAQTLRKRYSQTGSYFSVRPIKLPNRRLLWPADAVLQLIRACH
jgi:hypothetical protein